MQEIFFPNALVFFHSKNALKKLYNKNPGTGTRSILWWSRFFTWAASRLTRIKGHGSEMLTITTRNMLHKETYSVRSGDISFLLSVVLEHARDYEAEITFVILFWLFILVKLTKLIVKNGRLVCIFNFQHSVLDLLSENISN